jgi:OOP family OmpA-OmpF porin
MKSKIVILIIAFGMMLIGFLATDAGAFEVFVEKGTVNIPYQRVDTVRTANSFIVLFDSSSSMGDRYGKTKMRKIDIAMDILEKKNKELPDLAYNAGLYSFPGKSVFTGRKALAPYYELKPYNKAQFTKAIGQLPMKTSGPTPLQPALRELDPILKGLPGRTVVFVYNDGQYSRNLGARPVELARELAGKYDVCFYMIHNARGKKEEKNLEAVASINECSRKVSFDELQREPELLTAALYGFGSKALMRPETREKVVGARAENILFDFDKSDIKPEFHSELDALGKFLQDYPRAHVTLSGFTDSMGREEYNMGLSRRRVESVSHYLAKGFNIGEERMVLNWYGKAGPADSNETMEGRYQNRRVTSFVAGLK